MKVDYKQDFEDMMTINDLCDHLHIERKKAYKICQLDTFPAIRIGKQYVIPRRLYLQWLRDNVGNQIVL